MQIESYNAPSKMVPYLLSVERGKDQVLRSPIYGELLDGEVAIQWLDILESNRAKLPGPLFELEIKEIGKIGPKSVQLPLSERMLDISAYYAQVREGKTDLLSEISVDPLSPLCPNLNRIRPMSAKRAVDRLPKNTNSGLPFFTKRNRVVKETIEMVEQGDYLYPAVLGWRGQSNGTLIPKQRVVWMFGFPTNAQETRFTAPVFDELKRRPWFSAWTSMDSVDYSMTHLMNMDDEFGIILSSDYSGFDQHIRTGLMGIFKKLMKRFIQFQFHAELDIWIDNILNVDLVISTTEIIRGAHGLSSGSAATNLADTVINCLAQINSPFVKHPYSQFLGDDGVLRVTDVDRHLDYLESLGLSVNPEKQMVGYDVAHYLQRLYMKEYRVDGIIRGVYPGSRAIGSVLYPERVHDPRKWNKVMETVRWISIAENCEWHPLYKELVLLLAKGDDYLRENLRYIVRNAGKVRAQSISLPGFVPLYNDGTKGKGLLDFATVKLLRKYFRI